MNLKSFKKESPIDDSNTKIDFKKGPMNSDKQNSSLSRFTQPSEIEINLQSTIKTSNKAPLIDSVKNRKEKKPLSIWKKILLFILVLLIIAGSGGGYFYWTKIQDLRNTGIENVGVFDPFSIIAKTVDPNADKKAINDLEQTDGRTNVLTIGIDARGNDGSLLTDSMIVNSYDHKTNRVTQFSMPRDFLAPYNNRYDKLNSVYPFSFSASKQQNKSDDEATKQGIKDLSETIEKVTGMKIHYGLLINFRGFKDLVDAIGGIEVDVENSFTDYTYPNDSDTAVITVSFKAGKQSMNGTRALQYARSRHSPDNNEGTDFARARRQQKVINAIREKVLASNLLSQADFLNKTLEVLGKNLKFYNVSTSDIDKAVQSKDVIKETVLSGFVVDTSIGSYPEQLIKGGSGGKCYGLDGYYACSTKAMGDYSQIQKVIAFNLANPEFVEEQAVTQIIWTNSKKYKDYDKVRDSLIDEYLPFTYYEGLIYVAPSASGTVTPTTSGASFPSITIYTKADAAKPKTLEVYKRFFDSKSYTYIEKSSTEAPKELATILKNNDILLVLE